MKEQELTNKDGKVLPRCVIFDIDGTIANNTNRNIHDLSKINTDTPIREVINLLKLYYWSGMKIVLMTGRLLKAKEETEKWLRYYDIPYHELYMRPSEEDKDLTFKRDIFEEKIRGRLFCEVVVEDRDRVVKMWREELELTCLQCAYGDF